MDEYIKKEAVLNFIEKGLNNPDKTKSFGHDAIEIMAEVRYMPAADVVEVRRGEWIYGEFDIPHCSECGYEITPNMISPYCPNCGARMDGDTE